MLNWPPLILAGCAYFVLLMICGAYQGPMPDAYRWLALTLSLICFGGIAVFIACLKPRKGANHETE